MASVLDSNVAEIPEICRRYGVARLELFGSAAGRCVRAIREAMNRLALHDPGTAGRMAWAS